MTTHLPAHSDRGGRAARAATLQRVALFGLAAAALAACTETPINEAPVIDRSVNATHGVIVPAGGNAAPAAAGATETLYTVQKGDTLFRLASQARASVADLARWNGIAEGTPIFVGQQLRLQPPPAPAGTVPAAPGTSPAAAAAADEAGGEAVVSAVPLVTGDGVQTRSLEPPVGMAAPAGAAPEGAAAVVSPAPAAVSGAPPASGPTTPAAESAPAPEPSVPAPSAPANAPGPGRDSWIWPVAGTVTRRFEPPRSKGIDIAVAEDAPVVAVADGTVLYTGAPRDYGKLVVVKHGEELLSVYAHSKSILVKEGQAVQRGQVLATAGATGSGPAILHFEARRNRVTVDPLELLPPR